MIVGRAGSPLPAVIRSKIMVLFRWREMTRPARLGGSGGIAHKRMIKGNSGEEKDKPH